MSSACVCHTDERCFYCEVYSPLEKKYESLKREIDWLKSDMELKRDASGNQFQRTPYLMGYRFERDAYKDAAYKLKEVLREHEDPSNGPSSTGSKDDTTQ